MDVKVVIKLYIISFRAICFAKHFALLQFLLCGDVHCLLARGKRKESRSRGEGILSRVRPLILCGEYLSGKALYYFDNACNIVVTKRTPARQAQSITSYFLKMIAKKVWKMRLRSLPKLQVAIYSKLHCSLSGIMYWI